VIDTEAKLEAVKRDKKNWRDMDWNTGRVAERLEKEETERQKGSQGTERGTEGPECRRRDRVTKRQKESQVRTQKERRRDISAEIWSEHRK